MDVKRLNINVGGEPSPGYAGPEEVFDRLAMLVGNKVPQEYIDFIRQADGGCPELGYFRSSNGYEVDIDSFYGFKNPEMENIFVEYSNWSPLIGKGAIPFGRDGGGGQFYIATNINNTIWKSSHIDGFSKTKIAENFQEFLRGLEIDPDLI